MTKKNLIIIFVLQLVTVFFVILNSQSFYFSVDTTKNQQFTVSKFSQDLLNQVQEEITITYYLSSKLKELYPQVRDVKDFLYTYASNNNKIHLTITDPSKLSIENNLSSLGIYSQQIETIDKGNTSYSNVYSGIVIEYLGKSESIPFVLSTSALEFELSSRVQYLLTETPRKVAIIIGNDMTVENDFSYAVQWLEAAGFVCSIFDKTSDTTLQDFISTTDLRTPLFVIGSSQLSSFDVETIESFIMKGGKALFNVSKNNLNIYTDWSVVPKDNTSQDYLFPLLDAWGISSGNEIVMDISNYRIRMQSSTSQDSYEYINYPQWIQVLSQFSNLDHKICSTFSGVQLYWSTPLRILQVQDSLFSVYPILNSSSSAWLMTEDKTHNPSFITDPFLVEKLKPDATKDQYTLVAGIEGSLPGWYEIGKSKDTRLVVVSSQYFASNIISYTDGVNNLDFTVNCLLWLSSEDEILSIKQRGFTDTSLYNLPQDDELNRAKIIDIVISIILIPVIFMLFGTIFILGNSKKHDKI